MLASLLDEWYATLLPAIEIAIQHKKAELAFCFANGNEPRAQECGCGC
jgi:hypothetical protein